MLKLRTWRFVIWRLPVLLIAAVVACVISWISSPAFAAESHASVTVSSSVDGLPDAPLPQPGVGDIDTVSDSGGGTIGPGDQKPGRGAGIAQRFLNTVDPGYLHVGDKWDVTINKGEIVRPFTKLDKIHYAWEEEWSPFTIFDGAWSAGYEQLRNGNPKFGSDSAGYGERFGAAMFRQGTYRLFGDGVLPALLHEDPRYYRVAEGSFWFRATRSARQVVWDHKDDGSRGIAYSTLMGEVISNTLPLPFYPSKSVTANATLISIGTSLADDAALKLFREFLPDALQAFGWLPKTQ
jgi:hypothetical protein